MQVTSVPNAHDGGKVNCLAIGPDGVIYTGGDDKVINPFRHITLHGAQCI